MGLPGTAVSLLEKFGTHWVLVDGVVAGDDRKAALGDEVVLLVFVGIVADDGTVRDVDIAVDDGVADSAVASDVDVGKDDAGVDIGVGVDAHVLG